MTLGKNFMLDYVLIPISGAGAAFRKLNFEKLVSSTFDATMIIVLSDIEVLKQIVLRYKTGVFALCGTGSVSISHSEKKIGECGYLFGDEAGAFAISLEIFRDFSITLIT